MNLIKLLQELVNSADQEGCSPDLTVVAAAPVEQLKILLDNLKREDGDYPCLFTIAFGNAFDGIVLGGLFTNQDSAIEYASECDGGQPWEIARIYPAQGDLG